MPMSVSARRVAPWSSTRDDAELREVHAALEALQVLEQPFANVAPEIPRLVGVRGRNDGAHGDGALGCVGDLQAAGASIPGRMVLADARELRAERLDGGRVIDLQLDLPQELGRRPRPVLEWGLEEPADRHDEA